ncbi:unnamed protein product [Closterium sp. NIES-53]
MGVLSLRVLSMGVLSWRVRSLGVLSLGVLLCLEVLLVLRSDCLRISSLVLEVLELLLELVVLGGARTRGAGVAGSGGVGGAGVGDPTEHGAAGARGSGAGGAGAGGAGIGGTGAGGAGAAGSGAVDPKAGGPGATILHSPTSVVCVSSYLACSHCSSRSSFASSSCLRHARYDPSFKSTPASTLVAELLYFAAACCLDYATVLVAESASASPLTIGGECALGTDILEDRHEDFECLAPAVPRFTSMLLAPEGDPDAPDIPTLRSYAEAITGPYSSQWHAAMDAEMASWKSTGTYVDEVPPRGANIVDGMWILRVKRPPGSPPALMMELEDVPTYQGFHGVGRC